MGMAIQIQYSSERFSPASSSDPLSLSLVPKKKKREDWTHRRCKEYEQLQNVSMYVQYIVYNIESAAATK